MNRGSSGIPGRAYRDVPVAVVTGMSLLGALLGKLISAAFLYWTWSSR